MFICGWKGQTKPRDKGVGRRTLVWCEGSGETVADGSSRGVTRRNAKFGEKVERSFRSLITEKLTKGLRPQQEKTVL